MIPFRGLSGEDGDYLTRPLGKYKEIFDYVLKPDPEVKSVDLCCGLGFGKTLIAIQIAALTLDSASGHVGMFLEPDWDRVKNVFLPMWEDIIPEELYRHDVGKRRMTWLSTGSSMIYRPRVITGSVAQRRAKNRGIPTSFVIDDETAIGFDRQQQQNTYARIRLKALIRYYLTLSTPLVGPYGRFLRRGGNKIFTGRTKDNFYLHYEDPTYESRQRANMSEQQARRELDGELVALEGRIWKDVIYDRDSKNKDCAWPKGNRHDQWTKFRSNEPWWLAMDIGRATGAYTVIQQTQPEKNGRRLFRGPVWVAVADLCPKDDASAQRAFQLLDMHFGSPVAVVAGADLDTGASTDGETVAQVVDRVWGPGVVRIFTCDEHRVHKLTQFDCLNYLWCSSGNERRLTIARDFVSLDKESHRGVREMVQEDQWMEDDKKRVNEILPKNKEIIVQHIRDSLLMWAATIGFPPKWRKASKGHGVK
jgi:hypothetical protein